MRPDQNHHPTAAVRWPVRLMMATVAGIGALVAVFRATVPDTAAFTIDESGATFQTPAPTFPALLELYTGTRLTAGNRVEPLLNGEETYPRLWSDLRSARKTITVQSYYAKPGALSDTLSKILRQRARAGVRVRLLFDAFGSEAMPSRWYDELRRDGVRAAVLRPLHWYNLHGGADRSHVRAIIVDGRVGYTGGFGFADYWHTNRGRESRWRETNVRVEGPAALQLQAAFGTAWLEATGELLTGPIFIGGAAPGDAAAGVAGLLFTTTTTGSTAAERFLALALLSARQRLYVTNSYFVPNADLRKLLIDAAARGVDVRVLTADSKSDVKTTWYAARHHYEELLRGGVRLYEYGAAMMHAKTLVVDGAWAAIGSMNFDNRSLAFNDESTLIAYDSIVARRMEEVSRPTSIARLRLRWRSSGAGRCECGFSNEAPTSWRRSCEPRARFLRAESRRRLTLFLWSGTMRVATPRSALVELSGAARALTGSPADFDAVLELAKDHSYVMIGEASHGTHEFYDIRAQLTKRLITEHDFSAVAIEGDWPDAYRVNRWVRGVGDDADAEACLGDFLRFPQWMWRNADVLDFVGWLRSLNENRTGSPVGFYGLDLYSLHASREAVLTYLRKVDPEAALRAAKRYACFDHFGDTPQEYGYAAGVAGAPSCENDVVRQLVDLRARAAEYARRDGRIAADDLFFAEQNAKVVVNAEHYYRAMYAGGPVSWNLRDRHMHETLQALIAFLSNESRPARVVVWAHNSHLGDARATEMGLRGEWNLGQLVRQADTESALLVGFTTYEGSVTAASDWDRPMERKQVRPALLGSYEALFHEMVSPRFFLDLRTTGSAREILEQPRLERAIGVIYRPETERLSHYFVANLPHQFDVVFHYDRTRAVEPLERTSHWLRGEELPETYPSAL